MKQANSFESPKATFSDNKVLSYQNMSYLNQIQPSNSFNSSSSNSNSSNKCDTLSNKSEILEQMNSQYPLCDSDSSE